MGIGIVVTYTLRFLDFVCCAARFPPGEFREGETGKLRPGRNRCFFGVRKRDQDFGTIRMKGYHVFCWWKNEICTKFLQSILSTLRIMGSSYGGTLTLYSRVLGGISKPPGTWDPMILRVSDRTVFILFSWYWNAKFGLERCWANSSSDGGFSEARVDQWVFWWSWLTSD